MFYAIATFLGIQLLGVIFADAYAWGPAAHLHYGLSVLDHLGEVAEIFRVVIAAEPLAFLYGNVGADIVLAKKLGAQATHCHRWQTALPLLQTAKTNRTQAFALGYLSHLAADTISHNCYVPSKTVASYEGGMLKHLYWEMRFDERTTSSQTLRLFQEIARSSFEDCDRHMIGLIPTRIFGFNFNKGVFNRLLILQSLKQWQDMLASMGKSGKNPLADDEFEDYRCRAQRAVFAFLRDVEASEPFRHDPIGAIRLRQAQALRRHYSLRKDEDPSAVYTLAGEAARAFREDPVKTIQIEDYQLQ